MVGKSYTYCLRSGLEVTDDNAKVTCFTCAKLIEEGRRMMNAIGRIDAKPVRRVRKLPSIYGADGRVNV